MDRQEQLKQIRESEKKSHIIMYSNMKLYEEGSWLQKPIKTVLDIIPFFKGYEELRVLDLGCGVGRNSICIAQNYKDISCRVDCVDILDMAIEKLEVNAIYHGVERSIKSYINAIEEYSVSENTYDLIMAISALEHIDSEETFINKLKEIHKGIHEKGIICLVVNSNVKENDKLTGEPLIPQFEVNFKTEELERILRDTFAGWEIIKSRVVQQKYDIPRDNRISQLVSDVVTFVARKGASA